MWLADAAALLSAMSLVNDSIAYFAIDMAGKTILPDLVTVVKDWREAMSLQIGNAQRIIVSATSPPDTNNITQLEAAAQMIFQTLGSLMGEIAITDSDTLNVIQGLVDALTQADQAIVGVTNQLVQDINTATTSLAVQPSAGDSPEQILAARKGLDNQIKQVLEQADQASDAVMKQAYIALQQTYISIVSRRIGKQDLDTALGLLQQSF